MTMTHLRQIALVLALAGCAATERMDDAPAETTEATGDANKAIVAKFLEAELKGDTAGMSALLTDDYIGYGLGVKDSANKARTLKGVQDHWETYQYGGKRYARIQALAATTTTGGGRGRPAGDWVMEWGDISTEYPSRPEYGNKAITATFAYHAAFQIRDGKIATRTQYFNHEDIMKQLGYKLLSVDQQQRPAAQGFTYK
jgi:ketosteroid isomerase-like protein